MRHIGLGAMVAVIVLVAMAVPASAQTVSREQDIADLRVGQRVLVDDGSCPSGQIKQVTGAQLKETGVVRTRTCVPRLARK
ncbi:DUF6719 family protein [Bradyrhizobium sp. ORS 86]|uniref:DUF6719 family protein n=1 Tax=Bradyrhizobium sp. ORS 86 TaxID=1685970 RepID=UPI00388FF07B